jgi:hypothetical protein
VPGLTPHPVKDPSGHSYGASASRKPERELSLPQEWRRCHAYLLGVDLFNQAYFWEAHEAWEEVWLAVERRSTPGRMVQGMIQVAAALLRQRMGTADGAQRNFAKAASHFEAVEAELALMGSGNSIYMGVDLPAWRSAVERYLVGEDDLFPYLLLQAE